MRVPSEITKFHRIINAVDILDANKNEIMVWISNDPDFDSPKLEVSFSKIGHASHATLHAVENVDTTIYYYDTAGTCVKVTTVKAEESNEFMALGKEIVKYLTKGEF